MPAGAADDGAATPPAQDGAIGPRIHALLARWRERRGGPPSYWLTRFVILRLLGLVYFFAFLSLARQVLPLIGQEGLLPAGLFLQRVEARFGSRLDGFLQLPSLFWIDSSDSFFSLMAWLGVVLSVPLLLGFANAILMAFLWALYMSFVHIGQDWYGYGWEIQLLETGFLGIFLCPLLDPRPFPRRPPPVAVIWLFRWLAFRIMLGAGLIKIRGDSCWRDLTCLYFHYETQPIPNPLSRALHFMPRWFHNAGALFNHLNELIVPWFGFGPPRARHVAGALLVSFQVILILSGNLSFLNWLTIVPILACFDDSLLRRVLPGWLAARAGRAAAEARASGAQRVAVGGLVAVVAVLSVYPVMNLLSERQRMNTSFNRLSLVNTYGAFGSVGRARGEIVFEGTSDPVITDRTVWREYEFKCKPGDPRRRPCIIAPYQPRIDWQIWFAAMSNPDRYPWTVHLAWKLLHNDPGALGLLAGDPFPDAPPRHVRAEFYRYEFAPPGDPGGAWWRRTLLGIWLPPLSADDPRLQRFLAAYGWLPAAGGPGANARRDSRRSARSDAR
ncbi:MAG: lipase maturation factor family protein [Acidobacteria bacterium]|nr:lipase maturation factor family protein [Acidobacteriota bacterium]